MIVIMQEDHLKCSALVTLVQHYLNAMVHPTLFYQRVLLAHIHTLFTLFSACLM